VGTTSKVVIGVTLLVFVGSEQGSGDERLGGIEGIVNAIVGKKKATESSFAQRAAAAPASRYPSSEL